jgi:hypothetical protein
MAGVMMGGVMMGGAWKRREIEINKAGGVWRDGDRHLRSIRGSIPPLRETPRSRLMRGCNAMAFP